MDERAAVFAAWLGDELARRDQTPGDLARALGGNEPLVRAWLAGARLPTPAQAGRLAAALRVPEAVVVWRLGGGQRGRKSAPPW